MTDAEIIKAFEGLVQSKVGYIYQDVLDLLKRLKGDSNKYRNKCQTQKSELARLYEENNRQKAEIEALINGQETLQKHIAEQKAEIERLQKAGEEAVSCFTRMESLYKIKCKELEVAKTEAIKEFAERLKEKLLNSPKYSIDKYDYFLIDYPLIDNLVKEMAGEDDA